MGVTGTPAESLVAALATRLTGEPAASLALLRSALTNPEAADALRVGAARYQEQISQALSGDDAELRAAILNAVSLGLTVSRHLLKSDALATADPAHIVTLLRPAVLALTGEN